MDFADRLYELAARIPKQLEHIQTEEATKNALVLPFINALGYNVFDPTEVVPEFTADVGIKKGEKVDYAIFRDGKPIVLFECKARNANLDTVHASQLFRYFTVTDARFGVLTNGVVYRFFTDLDAPNKMDSKPFLEFNLLDIEERLVDELKKFTKSAFDVGNILTVATDLKYTREIKRIMSEQMQEPSYEFVKFFASQVYPGRMTQGVREQFEQITKRALNQFINDQINERLKTALAQEGVPRRAEQQPVPVQPSEPIETSEDGAGERVVTTDEELEGYYAVKAILREIVDPKRVVMRDVQTYCGILLDDNNRKPICRLRFNTSRKYLGLFDGDKREERILIDEVDEIYKYADRLKATVGYYDG